MWDASQAYLGKILENITEIGWDENVFMSINFPHCAAKDVKDIQKENDRIESLKHKSETLRGN